MKKENKIVLLNVIGMEKSLGFSFWAISVLGLTVISIPNISNDAR